jgi:hypothetical protein
MYEAVMEGLLGVKMKQLSADWHKSMEDAYTPLVEKTQMPGQVAKTLFKGVERNPYNIAPSISPDGREIVFLSTRDLFSIDLYLADVETGRVGARSSRRPSIPTSRASSSSARPGPGTRWASGSSSPASPGAGPC